MFRDGYGERTAVVCCLVLCGVGSQVVSDGFGERTLVGLLFGVMWCRVTGG